MGQPTAKSFQMCKDGDWANATSLALDADDGSYSEEVVDEVLNDFFDGIHTDNVAFEVFFETPEREECFFGMRIEELSADAQKEVIRALLVERLYEGMDYGAVMSEIEDVLDTDVRMEWPQFKEIGFEGLWKNRWPVVVEQDGAAVMGFDELVEWHPQYNGVYDDAPIMMEFGWNKSEDAPGIKYSHWAAVKVSEQDGQLSRARFEDAMRRFKPPFLCAKAEEIDFMPSGF